MHQYGFGNNFSPDGIGILAVGTHLGCCISLIDGGGNYGTFPFVMECMPGLQCGPIKSLFVRSHRLQCLGPTAKMPLLLHRNISGYRMIVRHNGLFQPIVKMAPTWVKTKRHSMRNPGTDGNI